MVRTPEGYGLVAKTDTMNGATVVRGYLHREDFGRVLLLVEYATPYGGKVRVSLGPFDKRVVAPLITTLKDIEHMPMPNFLGEE